MGAGSGNRTAYSQRAPPYGQIVYDVAGDGIYTMNVDGSANKRILSDDRAQYPSWSSGGTKIAYTRNLYGLFSMNADGSGSTFIANSVSNASNAGLAYSRWSMSGSNHIAFEDDSGDPTDYFHATIDVVNSDGTGLNRITFDGLEDTAPSWSPNGSQIAFAESSGWGYNIFTMNADGSGEQQLTFGTSSSGYEQPDWSPDGMSIVVPGIVMQPLPAI